MPSEKQETIGARLKSIRKGKDLSQKAFAELLSTSSGYISEVEQGKMVPGGSFLCSLNREFGVSIDWLLTGDGAPYVYTGRADPLVGVVDVEHIDLVMRFQDKSRAKTANLDLLEIERIDRDVFVETVGYIRGVVNGLRRTRVKNGAAAPKNPPKNGTEGPAS